MDEETIQAIKKTFSELPKDVQDTIMSSEYQDTLIEIGKLHQLTVGQLAILEKETTMVMMGLTKTQNFIDELAKESEMDRFQAEQIVTDVNSKIFLKIREKMITPPQAEIKKPEPIESREDLLKQIENPTFIAKPMTPSPQVTQPKPSINLNLQKELPAGIPEELELPPSTQPASPVITKAPEVIVPPKAPDILSQKLSGSFQIPKVETEHSPENLTKVAPTPPKAYPPKADPYRLSPDE